jgi:U3 small nucleolar RNA-associated protein 20
MRCRFVVTHWSDADNGDTLCVLLPRLVSSGILPDNSGNDGFTLPQSWQDQIVSKFERLEIQPFPEQASLAVYDRSPETWHDRCLPKYNALLEVLQCTIVHPSTNARIAEILLRKLKLALRPSSSLAPEEAHFIVGRGFTAFSKMTKGTGGGDESLKPLLRAAAPRYARLPNFLEALLAYETNFQSASQSHIMNGPQGEVQPVVPDSDVDEEPLIACLLSNLSTDAHDLRLLSLRLLDHFYRASHGLNSEALSVMIMIEQTPLSLQTSRSASMHLRKLATQYTNQKQQWLKQSIIHFCFGMFTIRYSQIWEDASTTLVQIAGSKDGEEFAADLAFQWLEIPSLTWNGSRRTDDQSNDKGLTDFECSNMIALNQLATTAELEIPNARDQMFKMFKVAQQLVDAQPTTARAQALRVLSKIPSIAEKRSRKFVPMFLSWAVKQDDEAEQNANEQKSILSDWTKKDQKAQLDIFRLFENPKVLYKSKEVYDALLDLLANGDIEMQKSALSAIFTWKNGNIRPYEENLLNLLDEARFKEEISVLFQGEARIQAEHREHLMPVLLRLLYGRTISRKGVASGKQGMEARRLTVLRNLGMEDINGFLDIALGSLKDISLIKDGAFQNSTFEREILPVRKQVGFVNMIEALLKELKSKAAPFTTKLLEAVLYCIVYASRRLQGDLDSLEEDNQPSQTSLLRAIRQTGLKCLILLFNSAEKFNWSPYLHSILEEVVHPRLDNLPVETAQGVSGVLRLLFTWSSSPETVMLLSGNCQILPKVAECLAPKSSKDEVKLFALSIIGNVLRLSREDSSPDCGEQVKNELLDPNIDIFLTQIGGVLRDRHDISNALLESCVETVSDLAPFVSTSSQAYNLVDVSIFLLDQPSRRVNPKTKGALLLVLEHFVPLYELQNDAKLKDRVYNTITSLFGFFKDNASREVLSRVLMVYAQKDPVIREVASLCMDLNSFSPGRLDQPDYDRRLRAFNAINSRKAQPFTAQQWTPLLFNLLFYIKHDEEFGILSSNSSDSICQFIDSAGISKCDPEQEFKCLFSTILLPALFSGVREESEIIRREYLKVMAHLVRTFPTWIEVSDMHGLLAGEDELESSFFNNILTAGKGRQSSALGQLSAAAEKGQLGAKNVSHFFIPLVEHFIFNRAEGNEAHNIAAEATNTVGILATALEWSQYRALLRRFIGYIEGRPELEKQIIRLLGKVIDALAQAAVDVWTDSELNPRQRRQYTLAVTMPTQPKLAEDLNASVLPRLTAYLHQKDDSTVSLRVPVAIIIVRLLKLLPQQQLNEKLPAVLTDICHILRSKAQESRDMTRDTLANICVLLGPSCFGFVLKELRGALARGYQLHVLSYTMHSILVATAPDYVPGSLDYCLPSIMNIIMDDIFGVTGQEKDAEEYVSKMKEVKSSKSHDSMELIARTATLSRLTDLIRPIQVLLKEKLSLKMTRKIDELLNRVSSGLLKNPEVHSRDSLIFCYEIIQDVYTGDKTQDKEKQDYRLKRYLIQNPANRGDDRARTTIYTYKLVRFAFDVLRSVLKKYDDLRTASNLAGFIPILGDAVVQSEEEVKVAAFRLLSTIVKVPLKPASDGTNLYKVAVGEAIKNISTSATTESEASQAALKLISVVLRDRPDVLVKDAAVDDILERLKEDMTEPDRRHVTFNFLRAVMDSNVETATVYDTLDYVGTIMVTNDDKDTRDLARGAYFQFLREYPQKKNRWAKQLAFVVANLEYEREGGRLSILEVIHLLLSKSSHEYVQEVSATSFVPLVFVLANDDSEKCRMAAGEVIKEIFSRADKERMVTFLNLLRSWIKQSDNPSVVRLALQSYGLCYESQNMDDSDIGMLLNCIGDTLNTASERGSDWEQIFAALQLLCTLVQGFPENLFSSSTDHLWPIIWNCLSYPHAWVKESAAKLVGSYFVCFEQDIAEISLEGLPLNSPGGLKLRGDDITTLVKRFANVFRTPGLTTDLAEETVKNLVFLGVVAGANNLTVKSFHNTDDSLDDEDDTDDDTAGNDTVLGYLFRRLSFLLRTETSPPRAAGLIPKTAALSLLERLMFKLSSDKIITHLDVILLPLHNLTDPSIPTPYSIDELFRSGYESLKSDAGALMESLKKKIGTKDFTEAMVKVREGVKDRRQFRTGKRRIEAVAEPEKYGNHKKKKGERKKERRKEKGQEHGRRRREY